MYTKDTKVNIDKNRALELLNEKLNRKFTAYLNSCVKCGLCSTTCHYYRIEPRNEHVPGYKVEKINRFYRRYKTLFGKILPKWIGAADLDNETIEELIDLVFGRCTMCNRCALHCSVGLDIGYVIHIAREILAELDLVPEGLQKTVDTARDHGNNMAISKKEMVETIEWLEEDLQLELDDENAKMPLNKKNSRILLAVNPREPKFFPLSLSAMGKIFHVVGEDWTISDTNFDVTNYGYYSGDNGLGELFSQRLVEETHNLNCEMLVLSECGHGYRANKWEYPNWAEKNTGVKTISILQLIWDYIRTGKIRVDKSKNQKRVTLHDPCNLVRNGGIIEEQRQILKNSVADFVEMSPNRANNFCCGGGGGMLSMGMYSDRRINAGKVKADQIKNTGAKIVATPCHNCIDQLMELNTHYKLQVEIKTVAELVADAIY